MKVIPEMKQILTKLAITKIYYSSERGGWKKLQATEVIYTLWVMIESSVITYI